jgi:hypothetical protein
MVFLALNSYAIPKNMHPNIWAMLYLTLVPSVLCALIAIILWFTRRKVPVVFIFATLFFLIFPVSFLFDHFSSEKKELHKRIGVYCVYKIDTLNKMCSADSMNKHICLTLSENSYSFNLQPCFADRNTGKWKWTEDLNTSYAVFDLSIKDAAWFNFDDPDSLKVIKDGRTSIIFVRKK